jgi:hypothetical protein
MGRASSLDAALDLFLAHDFAEGCDAAAGGAAPPSKQACPDAASAAPGRPEVLATAAAPAPPAELGWAGARFQAVPQYVVISGLSSYGAVTQLAHQPQLLQYQLVQGGAAGAPAPAGGCASPSLLHLHAAAAPGHPGGLQLYRLGGFDAPVTLLYAPHTAAPPPPPPASLVAPAARSPPHGPASPARPPSPARTVKRAEGSDSPPPAVDWRESADSCATAVTTAAAHAEYDAAAAGALKSEAHAAPPAAPFHAAAGAGWAPVKPPMLMQPYGQHSYLYGSAAVVTAPPGSLLPYGYNGAHVPVARPAGQPMSAAPGCASSGPYAAPAPSLAAAALRRCAQPAPLAMYRSGSGAPGSAAQVDRACACTLPTPSS